MIMAFQCSVKRGWQRAARPLPEREVSSQAPLLPAAAGGKREHWKAMVHDNDLDIPILFLLP